MITLRFRFILSLALVALAGLVARGAESFDQTDARFGRVLTAFVKNANVDYAKLKADPVELDAYLQEIAVAPAAAFARWPEVDRLALLLNLYNA